MKEYTGSKIIKKRKIGMTPHRMKKIFLGKFLGESPTDLHLNPKVRQIDAKIKIRKIYNGINWIYFYEPKSEKLMFVIEVEKGIVKKIREYDGVNYDDLLKEK